MAVPKFLIMLTEKQEQIIDRLRECFIESNKLTLKDFMGIKEYNENRKQFIEECRKSDNNFRELLKVQILADQKIAQESLSPLGFTVTITKSGGMDYLVLSLGISRTLYLKYVFFKQWNKEYEIESISGIRLNSANKYFSDISTALKECYEDIKRIYVNAH